MGTRLNRAFGWASMALAVTSAGSLARAQPTERVSVDSIGAGERR